MDSEPINPVKKPEFAPPRPGTSSTGPQKPVQSPASPNPVDTVSLSHQGQALSENGEKVAETRRSESKNADVGPSASERKKFSITDHKEVVVKVIDNKTREVIEQVPSEDQLKLKNAIRNLINDAKSNQEPV